MEPKISITKLELPLIWLDTSVLIMMTKFVAGKNVGGGDKERISLLFDVIRDLNQERKIICPESEQRDEIEPYRSDIGDFRSCVSRLSISIRTRGHEHVKRYQTCTGILAYQSKEKNINLHAKDIFYNDPIKKIHDKSPWIVDAYIRMEEEDREKLKSSKLQINTALCNLKRQLKNAGIKFEDQLRKESVAELIIYFGIVQKFANNTPLTESEENLFRELMLLLRYWDEKNGSEGDINGLFEFLCSPHNILLPVNEISARLNAHLLTSQAKWKDGDSMDIRHISMMLPYANIMVVDAAMEKSIKLFEYDKKFGTKIFSMQEFDALISELKKI